MNMDDFFADLFGYKPTKKGTGYELITNAVIAHLNKHASVTHDVFLKSSFSADRHQLDGLIEEEVTRTVVEAKDHTEKDGKVGRPEVQKLAGALLVLRDVDHAVLSSPTGFTSPAKTYVNDLDAANATPISLFVVRPYKDGDDEGRVRSINITLNIEFPDYSRATFSPEISDTVKQKLFKDFNIQKGETFNQTINTDGFYRADGSLIASIFELTSNISADKITKNSSGSWKFGEPTFIYIGDKLYEIEHLNYEIPFHTHEETISIEAGEPCIFVKSEDGKIDTLISKDDLISAFELVSKK